MFWAPCIILPLMGLIKVLEWIFAKLFGKKEPAKEQTCPAAKIGGILGMSSCPITQQPKKEPEKEIASKKVDWMLYHTLTCNSAS